MKKHKYLLIVFLIVFLIFFNGCKGSKGLPPTFQGLVISEFSDPKIVPIAAGANQENPFPDEESDLIEDLIEEDIEIGKSDTCDYYAEPNQDLFLIIKIYNPTEYDLLSCVVNGVRYHSYQFSQGSDYENIVIRFNSGKEPGKKELKLTEIQYSDGSKIREIMVLENNSASYGVLEQKLPSDKLDSVNITATSVAFKVKISDSDGLIEKNGQILKIYLYDGKEIVAKKSLNVGENNVKFEDLSADTLYQYAIATVYDLYDGEGKRIVILRKEVFRTEDIFTIQNLRAGADYISFDLDINDEENAGFVQAIELYQNGNLVGNLSENERLFSGLSSGTDYLLRVTYRYGEREMVKEANVRTHKEMPDVAIEFSEIGKTSFRYNLKIKDPDEIVSVSKIELFLGGDLCKTNTPEAEPMFTDLLSGREYQLKVTYVYDLEDGSGEKKKEVVSQVKTVALSIPEVAVADFVSSSDRFDFKVVATDPDETGEVSAVKLFEGEELVQEAQSFSGSISFLNLKPNIMYKIVIAYTYDLNDGQGSREFEYVVERATLPLPVAITDMVFLVQGLPRVGEELHARIIFDNPSHADILSCVVNGKEVSVALGKDKNSGIIIFVPETEGGDYSVEITNIKYSHFGKEINQELSQPFNREILILGELEVLGVYAEEERIGVEDSGRLYIDLKNETDYLVTELVINFMGTDIYYRGEEIEKIASNLISVPWKTPVSDYSTIYKKISLTSITYGLKSDQVSTKPLFGIETEVMMLRTLTPRNIATVEDLMNLEDGYCYRLTQDLDLYRTVWEPLIFKGILDGAGHSLKNLSVVSAAGKSFGLFANFSGEIKNLELADFYISVRTDNAFVGALCGRAGRAKIVNCNVYGIIDASGSKTSAGGLIGEGDKAEVLTSQIRIDYKLHSEEALFAGIVGKADEVILQGNLISGSLHISGNVTVEAFGNADEKEEEQNYFAYDFLFVENGKEKKFRLDLYSSLSDLSDRNFYQDILGWSTEVWDFSKLDYEKGLMPILKNKVG